MTKEEQRHSRSITVVLEYAFKSRVSALKLRLSCRMALWLVSPKSSSKADVHIARKSDLEMTSQPNFRQCGYEVGKQDGEAIPALSRSEYEPHLRVLVKLLYRNTGCCLHPWQPF